MAGSKEWIEPSEYTIRGNYGRPGNMYLTCYNSYPGNTSRRRSIAYKECDFEPLAGARNLSHFRGSGQTFRNYLRSSAILLMSGVDECSCTFWRLWAAY